MLRFTSTGFDKRPLERPSGVARKPGFAATPKRQGDVNTFGRRAAMPPGFLDGDLEEVQKARLMRAARVMDLDWPELAQTVREIWHPELTFKNPLRRIHGLEAFMERNEFLFKGANKRLELGEVSYADGRGIANGVLYYVSPWGGPTLRFAYQVTFRFEDGLIKEQIDRWSLWATLKALCETPWKGLSGRR